MKKIFISLLLGILILSSCQKESKHRVFIFTDINIDSGDPDDRQSLIHLFWYADELQIEGIVPDRWSAMGLEASKMVIDAYATDYEAYEFKQKGFPAPAELDALIAVNKEDAFEKFYKAASDKSSPLYVLVWGDMRNFGEALRNQPELKSNIRVLTIGTGLMVEEDMQYLPADWPRSEPCVQLNWNGFGRNEIYNDPQFNDLWWVEINWTYAGMFTGEEPAEMYMKLSEYGKMGEHMLEVTKNEPWARYFRVGDTPSVLYLIDRKHNPDDPTKSSWAGRFLKPFPEERPNFYTDVNGEIEWNYNNPCDTWENHPKVVKYSKGTLEQERPGMYTALLEKLDKIYNRQAK